MDQKIIFYPNIDDDPTDFTRLETFAQDSADRIVGDTIISRQGFAGFNVVKTSPTIFTVAPGRLYSGGKRYIRLDDYVKDVSTLLPVAGRRIISVVIWGQELDTDPAPRLYLLNAETGQSEPQTQAMVKSRVANINTSTGAEAPDPTPPIVDAAYTIVAYVTLTTTGISTIQMVDVNRVPKLDEHEDRLKALKAFDDELGPRVQTLSSDLAALAKSLTGQASQTTLIQLLLRVATIESLKSIPQSSVSSHANYFLDASGSELGNVLSHCRVQEGGRFPDANANTSQLSILNPYDTGAKIMSGILFPAYTRQLWLQTGEANGEIRLSSYSYQTNAMVQKTMSRQVTQYGPPFTVCSNSLWWQTGQYDMAAGIFRRDGETFTNVEVVGNQLFPGHEILRLQKFWQTTVEEPYWDKITIDHNINGSFVCETWLQGQDIWLEAVGLRFTRLADTGAATLAIIEVSKFGLPDLEAAISVTNVARNTMVINGETVVTLTPVFLKAGARYAAVVITAADHWMATVPGEQFTQGTLFTVLDGAYAQGDGTKDLWLKLYRAKPASARQSIQLSPLSLNGGILAIEINADTVIPAQCEISYEIQVAGVWYPLAAVNDYVLGQGGSIPPLLPFRATFLGSGDMMGAISLTGSQVKVSRPDVTMTHISNLITLPGSGSTSIRVIQRYESWDAAQHTASCKVLYGAGYATVKNPDSFSDVLGVDPQVGPYLERTYVFNMGAALTTLKFRTDMTTNSARVVFHTAWHKDYAL